MHDPYAVFSKWRPQDDTRATFDMPYKVYVVNGLWYASEVELIATCAVNAGVKVAMRGLAALLGATLSGEVEQQHHFAIKLKLNQLEAPIAAVLWKLKPDVPYCGPMEALTAFMGGESVGAWPQPAGTEQLVDWEEVNGRNDFSDDSDAAME